MRPRVIADPAPRAMDEVFDVATRRRLDDVADVVWGRDEPIPPETFGRELTTADAVVFGQWRHHDVALDVAATGVRALLEVAGGHHHVGIDYQGCVERGLFVGSCAPVFGPAVAEMGLALMLDALRAVSRSDREMRSRSERWLHDGNVGQRSLYGATVGFVGCGTIATQLRALLVPFGVTALGYDPPLASSLTARGFQQASLASIFRKGDVIVVLAAPTDDNIDLVDRRLLDMLTPAQTIVVLSRARVVDFDALTRLAVEGRCRVAADVFPEEPLPDDHPIREAASATIVPHIAGALPDTLHDIGRWVVDDLTDIFAGRSPTRMQYLDPDNLAGLVQPLDRLAAPAGR